MMCPPAWLPLCDEPLDGASTGSWGTLGRLGRELREPASALQITHGSELAGAPSLPSKLAVSAVFSLRNISAVNWSRLATTISRPPTCATMVTFLYWTRLSLE